MRFAWLLLIPLMASAQLSTTPGGGTMWYKTPVSGGAAPSASYQWISTAGVKSATGATPPASDGDIVWQWTDQVASTILYSNIPTGPITYKTAAGVGGINNKPTLNFTGTSAMTNITLGSSLTVGTIFVAAKVIGGSGSITGMFDSANNANRWFIYRDTGSHLVAGVSGGSSLTSVATLGNSTTNICAAKFNGASSSIWINNSSVGSGTMGTMPTLSSICVGALSSAFNSTGWGGVIFEVRIYNTALSDADISTVFGQMNATWALY